MRRVITVLLAICLFVAICVGAAWKLSKSKTFQLFGDLIYRVETDAPFVALTFDDGPSRQFTPDVLDILKAFDVRATFFVNGEPASRVPEIMERIVRDGHELGNHAYLHDRLIGISPATARAHLVETDLLIRAAGHQGPIHFRPPYGAKGVVLPWVLAQQDRLTVTWDVAPESRIGLMADDIVANALQQAQPGSVILLHPNWRGNDQTRKALPAIIEGLREMGLEPVPLHWLLATE